jgi:hypothetical protein
VGFGCILVVFGVLTFFPLLATMDRLSGGVLDQRQKALLPIPHETFEIIGPQYGRVDEMGSQELSNLSGAMGGVSPLPASSLSR